MEEYVFDTFYLATSSKCNPRLTAFHLSTNLLELFTGGNLPLENKKQKSQSLDISNRSAASIQQKGRNQPRLTILRSSVPSTGARAPRYKRPQLISIHKQQPIYNMLYIIHQTQEILSQMLRPRTRASSHQHQ